MRKLVLVTRVWPTHRPGGMPHVCGDRAAALAKAGEEVHVLTTSRSTKDGDLKEEEVRDENGVTVHYLRTPAHRWSKEFAEECERAARDLSPSFVHLDSFDRERVWWDSYPSAVTMHGFGTGAWLTKWNLYRTGSLDSLPLFDGEDVKREVAGLEKAKRVLGVSKWEVRMLVDQYGLRPNRVKLVYNPVAPCFFDGPLSGERNGFVSVAAAQQQTRGFPQAVRTLHKALGSSSYRVLTNLGRDKLPAEYRKALALVLPTSFAQGYDLAVAEARACGTPAIMSATGSYLDEAEKWDCLVRVGNEEDLLEAVVKVSARSWTEKCNIAGEAASVAEKHRPENHVRSWLSAVLG